MANGKENNKANDKESNKVNGNILKENKFLKENLLYFLKENLHYYFLKNFLHIHKDYNDK